MARSMPASSRRSDTADAITVILFGAAAMIVVIISAVVRAISTFRPGGIAWTVDVDDTPAEATVGSGSHAVTGIVESVLVIADDVNTLSRIAIGASIAVWAAAALLVIGCVMFVAWNFLRGHFFVFATARAFDVMGWTIVLGAMLVLGFDTMGRNGVLAAVGIDGADPTHPVEFWAFTPVWAIGIATGLIGVAFRRGIRLQRETEGLV